MTGIRASATYKAILRPHGERRFFQFVQLGAVFHAHLVEMFQVVGEVARAAVAVARIALQGAVEDLLELRRNLGIQLARRHRIVQQPVIHDGEGLEPVKGTVPVSIS